MGAFDDITSQYGKAAGNGNAFEDITTEYGYDVGNAPKPTFWDSVKNNAVSTVVLIVFFILKSFLFVVNYTTFLSILFQPFLIQFN